MSYCRFENTLGDLEDCKEALDSGEAFNDKETSQCEQRARDRLIRLCVEIVDDYKDCD